MLDPIQRLLFAGLTKANRHELAVVNAFLAAGQARERLANPGELKIFVGAKQCAADAVVVKPFLAGNVIGGNKQGERDLALSQKWINDIVTILITVIEGEMDPGVQAGKSSQGELDQYYEKKS